PAEKEQLRQKVEDKLNSMSPQSREKLSRSLQNREVTPEMRQLAAEVMGKGQPETGTDKGRPPDRPPVTTPPQTDNPPQTGPPSPPTPQPVETSPDKRAESSQDAGGTNGRGAAEEGTAPKKSARPQKPSGFRRQAMKRLREWIGKQDGGNDPARQNAMHSTVKRLFKAALLAARQTRQPRAPPHPLPPAPPR